MRRLTTGALFVASREAYPSPQGEKIIAVENSMGSFAPAILEELEKPYYMNKKIQHYRQEWEIYRLAERDESICWLQRTYMIAGVGVPEELLSEFSNEEDDSALNQSVYCMGSWPLMVMRRRISPLDAFTIILKRRNENALYELGDMYLKGLGVETNLQKAFDYFAKAAKHGSRIHTNLSSIGVIKECGERHGGWLRMENCSSGARVTAFLRTDQ